MKGIKRNIHVADIATLANKKMSANATNTSYTLGLSGEVTVGTPDVLYQQVVFIKSTGQIWTHGNLYGITEYNELENKPIEVSENNGFAFFAKGRNATNTASGQNSLAQGQRNEALGDCAHAEGAGNTAYSLQSHAEGGGTEAYGEISHTEGRYTMTYGYGSHAEGDITVGYGSYSHAEGGNLGIEIQATRAYTEGETIIYVNSPLLLRSLVFKTDNTVVEVLQCAFQENEGDYRLLLSEGIDESLEVGGTVYASLCAYGNYSHTEGFRTHASGQYSHAEGIYTFTTNDAEHACGKYNVSVQNKTLFSVGVGTTDNNRKNAVEVTTEGYAYILGLGGYDGTNVSSQNVKHLATIIIELAQTVATLRNNMEQNEIVTATAINNLRKEIENNELVVATAFDNMRKVIESNELVVATALGNIRKDIEDNELVTATAIGNIGKDIENNELVVATAFGNMRKEIENNEMVVATALGNVRKEIVDNELVTATALGNVQQNIENNELVTATALGNVKKEIEDNELVTATALGNVQKTVEDNEKVSATAINDINSRLS